MPERVSPDPRIRVGYVVLNLGVAGLERFVTMLITRLRSSVTATVYCLDSVGDLGRELQAAGVRVVVLGRRPGIDLRVCARLARDAKASGIEVLHAHGYTPFFAATLARLLGSWSTHVVFTEHGRPVLDVVSPRRRWTNRLLLGRLAHQINACSHFCANALVEQEGLPRRRVDVIPNGVELHQFAGARGPSSARERLGLDPSRRYVLNVARLDPIKDQGTLVRAFASFAEAVPDTDLLLAGRGGEREALAALARSLGVSERIRFLGVRRDVPVLLEAADVFVLSSLSESAPLAVLEAMAAGCPVVATRVGGIPELISDGLHGRLVHKADPDDLARALQDVLRHPEAANAMAQRALRRVRDEFDFELCARRHLDTYRLALGLAASPSPAQDLVPRADSTRVRT